MNDKQPKKRTRILNVRLSFPTIFTAKPFEAGDPPRYSASFLLDKETNKSDIQRIEADIAMLIKETWKTKPKGLKLCYGEGDEKDYDGYDDSVIWLSTGADEDHKPVIVDKNPQVSLGGGDARLFGGCYVNAVVSFWAQDHKKGGKRINASLNAIQYAGPGDPFGEPQVDAETVLEDNSDGEDDNTIL